MSNTEMVSFPRELSDDLAELIAARARVCGGGAFEIWEAICNGFGKPVEQNQGKPVLTLQPSDPYDERPGPWFRAEDLRALMAFPAGTKLYTHADPGEVERLRAENEQLREVIKHSDSNIQRQSLRISTQRTHLAEKEAQLLACRSELLDIRQSCELSQKRDAGIDAALSASSEPQKPSRCTSCDNCQGFNTGHNSREQKPYSISCDNCGKEARALEHAGLAQAWNEINPKPDANASAEPSAPASCTWTYNEGSFAWDTTCDESFLLMEDGPKENCMKFCPYCSKSIIQAERSLDS